MPLPMVEPLSHFKKKSTTPLKPRIPPGSPHRDARYNILLVSCSRRIVHAFLFSNIISCWMNTACCARFSASMLSTVGNRPGVGHILINLLCSGGRMPTPSICILLRRGPKYIFLIARQSAFMTIPCYREVKQPFCGVGARSCLAYPS